MDYRSDFILRNFAFITVVVSFTGCAVIKTPYTQAEYYRETVSRLEKEKQLSVCQNDSLSAGFAKASITPSLFNRFPEPEKGKFRIVPMAGYGERRGKSAKGIHDSLYIKAIAIRENNNTFVIVSGDLLIMPPNITDCVIRLLANKGINRNQLFFSATHTHSGIGGWAYGILGKQIAGKENKGLEKWLIEKIYNVILASLSDLRPSEIGYNSFDANEFTRNRLTGNDGIKNNLFNFIAIEQRNGKKAIIGTYSAHATVLGAKNLELSGDYPGYWERRVEIKTADLAMFCGGSMGSQSPVVPGNDFENAELIGKALAERIAAKLVNTNMQRRNTISSLSLKIDLPAYHFRLTRNRNLTTGLSNLLMVSPKNVYLQGLRINNLLWIFTPGDFSGEYAVEIRDSLLRKGFESVVTGYNGSYIGYIIPGKYFYMNHYEPKLMGWFGPTMGDYTMDLISRITEALSECK